MSLRVYFSFCRPRNDSGNDSEKRRHVHYRDCKVHGNTVKSADQKAGLCHQGHTKCTAKRELFSREN